MTNNINVIHMSSIYKIYTTGWLGLGVMGVGGGGKYCILGNYHYCDDFKFIKNHHSLFKNHAVIMVDEKILFKLLQQYCLAVPLFICKIY